MLLVCEAGGGLLPAACVPLFPHLMRALTLGIHLLLRLFLSIWDVEGCWASFMERESHNLRCMHGSTGVPCVHTLHNDSSTYLKWSSLLLAVAMFGRVQSIHGYIWPNNR